MLIQSNIIEKIKENKPCFFKNAFPKIFSWDELERLLNLRPFVNDRRLIVTDSNERYEWPFQSYMSDINTFPPTLIDNEIIKNHVCYLYDASRASETLNDIAKQIEKSFPGSASDAHIYFSVSEKITEGFGIHMDKLNVLLIHVEGKSQIEIWDSAVTEEIGGGRVNINNLNEKPIICETMSTGDAVFIPLNTFHKVSSITKRLSISFPFLFNDDHEPQDRHWIKLNV